MTRKNQKALEISATERQEARNRENGTEPTQNQPIGTARDHRIEADKTAARPACECGCGDTPAGRKSRFCPGHDAKAASALRGPKVMPICLCGCEGETKGGRFLPGHDARYHAAQKAAAKAAPLVDLVSMCEQVA